MTLLARKPDVIQQKGHERRLGFVPFASATATSHVPSAARFLHRSGCVQLAQSREFCCLRGRVGVHLALAAGHDDVHEAAGVCETLLRAALGDLLLLLLLDLCAHATSAICVLERGGCAMAVVVGALGGEVA